MVSSKKGAERFRGTRMTRMVAGFRGFFLTKNEWFRGHGLNGFKWILTDLT